MGETVTVQQIMAGFKRGTEYMLKPGVELKADSSVQNVNRVNLEYNIVMGNITDGDYHIIRAVYELGFATTHSLLSKLAVEKRRNPQVVFTFKDYASLRARLEFLTQFGLLFCYGFLDKTDTYQYIYFASVEGWRAYKNRLSALSRYDNNTVHLPPFELFRKVCANAVLCSFGASEKCCSIIGACEANYREEGRDKKAYLYGRATIEENGKKTRYIIEPVHFVSDEVNVSEQENARRISDRFTQLESVVDYYNNRDTEPIDTYLVVVLENYEGLQKMVSVIKNKNIRFFIDRCLFTNEYVVTRSAGGNVAEAVLGMEIKDKQVSYVKKQLTVQL